MRAVEPSVTLPSAGLYVLTLTASDGVHHGADRVVVQVGQRLTVELRIQPGSFGTGSLTLDTGGSCANLSFQSLAPHCNFYLASGTVVGMTATPLAPALLLSWTQDCAGAGPCQVTMSQPRTVRATFTSPAELTVEPTGAGGATGAVRVEPPDALCPVGARCAYSLPIGSSVAVSAQPGPGSVFSSWNTPACGPAPECVLAITGSLSLSPSFRPPTTLGLSLSSVGGAVGTVRVDPPGSLCAISGTGSVQCDQVYAPADVVTLTATPEPGSIFAGWSGDCFGVSPCIVAMSESRNVSAFFARFQTITVNMASVANGSGSVAFSPALPGCTVSPGVNTSCLRSVAHGEPVTLTATPAAGSAFAGWTGACSGTELCTLPMSADVSVTATFNGPARLTRTLTGVAGGAGSVQASPSGGPCVLNTPAPSQQCSTTYAQGQTISLTAVPGPQSVFDGWTGAC